MNNGRVKVWFKYIWITVCSSGRCDCDSFGERAEEVQQFVAWIGVHFTIVDVWYCNLEIREAN